MILGPTSLVLVTFWLYLALGPGIEPLHSFYGSRSSAEHHSPLVILAAIVIVIYSLTMFLPRRLLAGWFSRRWTIVLAVVFILIALATGMAALLNWSAAFL